MIKQTLLLATALTLALAPAAGGCVGDCEEGAFRCAGTVLQQCQGGDFATVEDCADKGSCMASFGACEATTSSATSSSTASTTGSGGAAAGGAASGGSAGAGG
jgi:hypothetical protein